MVIFNWSTKVGPGPLDQNCDFCDGSALIRCQILGNIALEMFYKYI